MKNRIILGLVMTFVVKQSIGQGYEIKGKVIGLKDSTLVLLRNVERDLPFDTTYVVNGTFEFKGRVVDDSEMFFIRTNPYKKYLRKRFFVENTAIEVVFNEDEEPNVYISGAVLQNQANNYDDYIKDIKVIDFRDKLERSIDYIKLNGNEDYMPYLIHERRMNLKNEQVKELYGTLSKKVKQSKYGRILCNYLDKSIDFTIGTPIKDFTLNNTNGNKVSLSDFKGKYVLLDFWGSWCGSCRSKYPECSRIYEKYKNKDFEIVGVSLDKDEVKWKRAIQKDGTQWTNLIDPAGFLGDIAVTYKVWTVPMAYFIGPDGKVIEPITYNPFTEEKLVKALKTVE